MGGNLEFLADGLVLVHPTLAIKTGEGSNLEGVGAIPDIKVPLDRGLLAGGVDNQLEAVVICLTNHL